jgi:predicted pyridoxine 5'-phosphate oxidase superfamily flavin-nucleotide-binding protein
MTKFIVIRSCRREIGEKFLAGFVMVQAGTGSFDCGFASRREANSSLRMTTYFKCSYMGKVRSEIDDAAREFIAKQKIFFVASAPLSAEGHVNVSPKGLDTFRILGPTTVAYLDFNGSGVETIAHLKENGRIVLMFCAFQGPPDIFRLYGHGRVIEAQEAEFAELSAYFVDCENARSVIVVEIERVQDSCGYGVPLFQYEGERTQLQAWARKRGAAGLKEYRAEKNRKSIDGLAGVRE